MILALTRGEHGRQPKSVETEADCKLWIETDLQNNLFFLTIVLNLADITGRRS
jgi:hypothetical protein